MPAHLDYVDSTGYATTLHGGGMTVGTVEHLLATLHAYGITNALIKVQSEVPSDGRLGAATSASCIEQAGVEDQGGDVDEIVIDEPLRDRRQRARRGGHLRSSRPTTSASPTRSSIPPRSAARSYTYVHRGGESLQDEIAPARTFGFVQDMKAMAAMGLASGGRLDNCILIDDEKIVNTQLRFPDEFARHKILDIMGDFYLLGRPLRGRIVARKTGHSDNIALLRSARVRDALTAAASATRR